jgi:hypothetical protein
MKVIIAGSRQLPTGSATFAQPLLDALTKEDTVLLRSPKTGEPGEFEKVIAAYSVYRDVPFRWMRPQPTEENPGRVSVYVRDIDMVAAADSALLFFTKADAEEGYSGTMHLLEKAIDADIKVDAFTVDREFNIERFGSNDGRVS